VDGAETRRLGARRNGFQTVGKATTRRYLNKKPSVVNMNKSKVAASEDVG
jgi:hypothetical protein